MFFAGVELLHYPQLKGLPVVVGGRAIDTPRQLAYGRWQFARLGDYAGRGVVTTSTYEARALGVFSAMGLMKAAAKAPDAIILPANFDAYRYYSRLFKQAVRDVAPHVEDRGIDEIYIDLSEHTEPSPALAKRLKDAVYNATGLTCSICIAPNKLLAKIGSELDKPDGLTLLDESSLQSRIWPLSVSKINGIGPKAVAKLATIQIGTIAELAQADVGLLQSTFGRSYAVWLLNVANGQDNRPVTTHSEPKSISRETTFERDLHVRHDRARLGEIFTSLCERVAQDLKIKRYLAGTVGIKLRYQDFSSITRDLTLPLPVGDAAAIRKAAGECLKRAPLTKKIRLLGVKLSQLTPIEDGEHPTHQQAALPFE
ncbi:DNA polymerase IV [Methylovorus menthalis]|uniref:DNA polymerase Y family protein n=1 Tax=Methylovorus menthalis TaxID=1002227 RepID=UPI001E4A39CD|nr:DNA polymerase IV [Methylovorus menthalis]MCB4811720.1 DNA polymerase IV [Methylovorus menthalis]